MKTDKKVSKPVAKKVVKAAKSTVKLTSYSIKAIIPTGPYANIQAEIVVNAGSLEEAKAYTLPHIDGLFEEYLNKSDRKNVAVVTVKETVAAPKTTAPAEKALKKEPEPTTQKGEAKPVPAAEVVGSVPFEKAKSAINSCLSADALELIAKQVEKSVKLNGMEKLDLGMIITTKGRELAAKK